MLYVSSSCLNEVKPCRIGNVIKKLAESDIRHIELSGGTEYYETIEQDLQELGRRYGLTYACHAYFPPPRDPFVVNLASCNEEIYRRSTDHYRSCISLLKRIGCRTLSVHAGFLTEIGTEEIGKRLRGAVVYGEEEACERFCSAYRQIDSLCEKAGITLYLENNVLSEENYRAFGGRNLFMMTDYESIMRMKEHLTFRLLLDLGHLHVSCHTLGLDYREECRKLKEHVEWLHISDNDGKRDAHRPLREESGIVKVWKELYDREMPVTLETVGDIKEILQSAALAEWRRL